MPLMAIPSSIGRTIKKKYAALARQTGDIRRFRSRSSAVPIPKAIRARASFSFTGPGTVLMSEDPFKFPPAPQSAADPYQSNRTPTAGEEMVKGIRNRLYETSGGLVVAEIPGEYEEEQGFGDESAIEKWMDRNNRASAGTTTDMGMLAHGAQYGMQPYAMDNMGDYATYSKGSGFASALTLTNDITAAYRKITGNGANPYAFTKPGLIAELETQGYPAGIVSGLIDTSMSIASSTKFGKKLYDLLYKPRQAAAPAAAPSKAASSAGPSMPTWLLPVAGIGLVAAFLFMRKKGAA